MEKTSQLTSAAEDQCSGFAEESRSNEIETASQQDSTGSAPESLFSQENQVGRRSFLKGAGYGSLALASAGLLDVWGNQATAMAAQSPHFNAAQPPVLLHASDAIKPGDLFSIHGEWLDAASAEVVVAAAATMSETTPPEHAQKATIVQTDEQGHFLVVQLPQQLIPGELQVWVRTSAGSSSPLSINQPRPLFLSEYEVWAGQELQIIGRNFDPQEFGGHGKPHVRLVDNGRYAEAQIANYNPFAITVTVPEVKTTIYKLEVSTNGQQWWPLPGQETVTVVRTGQDPLKLGVAWADHFHWDRVFNVSDHGVPITGGVDVTAQVQAVVSAAKVAGGGVVYFPAGQYQLSGIALPADIVLLGAGAEKTTLLSTAIGGNFITTSDDGQTRGHQGVAHLKIELKDPKVRPDTFLWLGEPWDQNNNVNDLTVRTASEVFVKSVNLTYSLLPPTVTSGQRGIGLEWIVKERALCADCHFVGYHAQPFINYITNYYTVKRNSFEYSAGNVVCNGSRSFYEENQVVGHREFTNTATGDDLHGLFARDRAYMANNVVRGVGTFSQNDGEALCVEVPGADFNYGSIINATPTTLTTTPQAPLTSPQIYFGYLAVAIIDGRGLGQMRRVTDVNSANNQLTVDRPWDVIPDTTSAFTLLLPLEQVTFYRNSITNCTKGLWFFGNTFDSVQADNTSTDSEGIFMWTVRSDPGQFIPGYFARIARNRVIGISPKSKHGGINYNTGRFNLNGAYFGTMAYGIEVRENFVSGDPGAVPIGNTESTPFTGLGASAASYSSVYDGNPVGGDGKNTIFAGNQLTELTTGINITHSLYGTIVANNTFTSTVSKFFDDTGSINTLLQRNS